MSAGTQTERFARLFLCDSDIGRGLEDDGEVGDGTQLLAGCRSSLPCWPCVWFPLRRAKIMARPLTFAEGFRDVDGKAWRRARQWPETSLRDRPPRTPHQRCNLGVGRNGRAGG